MSAIITFETDLQWLQFRRGMISGTDTVKIHEQELAVDWAKRYDKVDDIYSELWDKKQQGVDSVPRMNLNMRLGLELEDFLANLYEEQTGETVVDPYHGSKGCHVRDNWAIASVDFLVVGEDGEPVYGMDCKTTRSNIEKLKGYWKYQAAWYMYVLDMPRWDIFWLHF